MLLTLAWRSLCNRAVSVGLTLLALTLSVMLLVSVEHVRREARDSFGRTVSGVDLIVGARTSPLNLLLYSIFRIGAASNDVSWESVQALQQQRQVAWLIPLALGDSYQGYRVVGTTAAFFEHFHYGSAEPLVFASGTGFESPFSAVLGAEVARQLGHKTGDIFELSHGVANTSFVSHEDAHFVVSGILAPTGTPVDQGVHVTLQGMEAIHLGWANGVPLPGRAVDYSDEALRQLQPDSVTAVLLGLSSRSAVFGVQRSINDYTAEALTAILPGVALAELWTLLGAGERLLGAITLLVMLATLLGMATMLLASMRERAREIALYRAIGARPWFILALIELEAVLITLGAAVLGVLGVWAGLAWGQTLLQERFGLFLSSWPVSGNSLVLLAVVLASAVLLAVIPAVAAYRQGMAGRLKPAG